METKSTATRSYMHRRWIRTPLAFVIAVIAGALIWALSPRVTGADEPWDAEGIYYMGALAVVGFGIGRLTANEPAVARASQATARGDLRHFLVIYSGVFIGQLMYALIFLPTGPLIVLGVGFLAAYSAVAAVGAAVATQFRRMPFGTG
jgi:hypothetical protein